MLARANIRMNTMGIFDVNINEILNVGCMMQTISQISYKSYLDSRSVELESRFRAGSNRRNNCGEKVRLAVLVIQSGSIQEINILRRQVFVCHQNFVR